MASSSQTLNTPDDDLQAHGDAIPGISTEETPLLSVPAGPSGEIVESAVVSASSGETGKSPPFLKTAMICALFSVVADFGGNLTAAPEVRMVEMTVCREYYRSHDPSVIGPPPFAFVEESMCKIFEVQSEVARIRSLTSSLSVIPGLLLTLFIGSLADVYGRIPLILASFTGIVLSYVWPCIVCWFFNIFSARWILASPLFFCIGGGSQVLSALLASTIIDVTPRHLRTNVIYIVKGVMLMTEIVSPPIGSALMKNNVWIAYAFSIPILLMCFPILLFLPESLISAERQTYAPTSEPLNGERRGKTAMALENFRVTTKEISNKLVELLRVPSVSLLLAMTFLHVFALESGSIFLQFISKRLHWSLAHAAYLLSLRAAVALVFTIGVLPAITHVLHVRFHVDPFPVDVSVLRASFLALSVGYFLVGSASKPWLLIIGCIVAASGASVFATLQGIASSFTNGSNTAELFSAIAFAQLVGMMLGGPAGAAMFNAGMRLNPDSSWAGLPYYVAAVSTLSQVTSGSSPYSTHYPSLLTRIYKFIYVSLVVVSLTLRPGSTS